ncbi:hypothetical protein K9M79_05735 [Candidatus Woesearchaeota archaeon]|nr:hypothetical protein [Candidatus Woesearchaeota archaeon]
MDLIILIITSFLTGALVKFTDSGHKLKIPYLTSISGLVYGIGIGFVVTHFTNLSSLWIGMVAGVLFAGKIDKRDHFLGLLTFILTTLLLGIPKVNYIVILVIATLSILEEWINDNFVGKIKNKFLNLFVEFRPLMEFVFIIYSIVLQDYMIIVSLLFFDIGYVLIAEKLKKKNKKMEK